MAPSPGRTLLVASTGGHLAELVDLSQRLTDLDRPLWLTPDSEQSRDLLAGEDVRYLPEVHPRDYTGLVRAAVAAEGILRRERFARAVSTGAGIALAVLPRAATKRIASHYVESAARVQGPSLTGKLLARFPGVRVWTQYPALVGGPWSYAGSVFDEFEASTNAAPNGPLRVVVTVGTMKNYGFETLLRRLVEVLPVDAEVVWQTGASDLAGLPIDAQPWLTPQVLSAEMERADVVVAHAGVGSALAAMRAGAFPILVPRRVARNEHVDDHQSQIAAHLAEQGLAFAVEADQVDLGLVLDAARRALVRRPETVPIVLPA